MVAAARAYRLSLAVVAACSLRSILYRRTIVAALRGRGILVIVPTSNSYTSVGGWGPSGLAA